MRHLFLTLVFGLLAIQQSGFAVSPLTTTPTVIHPTGNTDCNLPAPENLILTNVTASSIDASWSPVPGAVAYIVEAYSVIGNNLLYSAPETGTSHTLTGLPSNTEIKVVITPVCVNGNFGASAVALTTTDIIIDIVTNNFQCPLSNPIVIVTALGGSASATFYPEHMYHAEVTEENKGIIRKNKFYFIFETVPDEKIMVTPNDSINLTPYGILVGQNNSSQQNSFQNEYIRIIPSLNSNMGDICNISFSWASSTLPSINIDWITGEPGAIRKLIIRDCASTNDTHQRNMGNGYLKELDNTSQVFPNPFYNFITINLKKTNTNHPFSVLLFDATGKLITSECIKSETQETITIPTADFLPGIYFIKIEDIEKIRLIKLSKIL